MTGLVVQMPLKLISTAVVGLFAFAVLTLLLGWHGVRRLMDVPRVPRPRVLYLTLGALWIGLVTIGSMSAGTLLLLRDHQRVDAGTRLADVRCEPVGPDRIQAELKMPLAAAPELYDFPGAACQVWVRQVQLRPGLGLLGVSVLSRVESVGPVRRPAVNSERGWLDLVARRIETISVAVPADAQVHSVLVSSGGAPTLADSRI